MEGVRVDEMHPIGMEIKRDGSGTENAECCKEPWGQSGAVSK